MSDEAMIVLTAKSAETILGVGGTQSWVLDRAHARKCQYLVVCQNAHTDWGDGKEPHGKAFMVGLVDDVVPSTETKGRWLVTFKGYAVVDKPDFWSGRNPVRYTTLGDLGFDIGKLKFKPMPSASRAFTEKPTAAAIAKVMTIAEAKQALALSFDVAPEAVEITIRG